MPRGHNPIPQAFALLRQGNIRQSRVEHMVRTSTDVFWSGSKSDSMKQLGMP